MYLYDIKHYQNLLPDVTVNNHFIFKSGILLYFTMK